MWASSALLAATVVALVTWFVQAPEDAVEGRIVAAGGAAGSDYTSLAALVRDSGAVVAGRVVSTAKGHPAAPDDASLLVRQITVTVDHQFVGGPVGGEVTVDTAGYDSLLPDRRPDLPFELEGQPWVFQGDRVIYFLSEDQSRSDGHYSIVGMPGQLIVRDGEIVTPANDPVADELDGASAVLVRDRMEQVAARTDPR